MRRTTDDPFWTELERVGALLSDARDAVDNARAEARRAVIDARAAGWTLEAIAGRVRVTRKTIRDWLEEDAKSPGS